MCESERGGSRTVGGSVLRFILQQWIPSDLVCITIEMRLAWILLPILAQGAVGDIFDVEPPRELVVHQGKNVTLECIIKPTSQCAWKVDAPDLTATGFLKSVVSGGIHS